MMILSIFISIFMVNPRRAESHTRGHETARAQQPADVIEFPGKHIWQSTEAVKELIAGIEEGRVDFGPYKDLIKATGLDPAEIKDDLALKRMALLDKATRTLDDEKKCLDYVDAIKDQLSGTDQALSEEELKVVKAGTIFTDIGKTGPANATLEQQMLVTSMYAFDGNFNPKETTAKQFIEKHFPGDSSKRIKILKGMDLDPNMTMREFYNLHVHWSYEIATQAGLPKEIANAAATHHFIEEQNPDNILDENGMFNNLESPTEMDRREVLVILLDKYDAALHRGGKTHAEAIEWLLNFVNKWNKKVIEKVPGLLDKFNGGIQVLSEALHPTKRESKPAEEVQ